MEPEEIKKIIESQQLRIATFKDRSEWAQCSTTHRAVVEGQMYELDVTGKVYVLRPTSYHTEPGFKKQPKSALLETVIDKPTEEMKQLVKDNDYYATTPKS